MYNQFEINAKTEGGIMHKQDKKKVFLEMLKHLSTDQENKEDIFQKLKSIYTEISLEEKEDLFKNIIEQMETPKEELLPLIEKVYIQDMSPLEWSLLLSELRHKISSPRLSTLLNISRIPGGLRFLLDMRSDILVLRRESHKEELKALDRDIVLLFELWFCEGFLYLEEITLDSTYRQIEIIKKSDLVHPMTSIEEMIKRLGKDRRCFALYHRLIPHEPIVFIEVAITKGIPKKIDEILSEREEKAKEDVDTAVFYSINNTQNGLAGLGLGKVLIIRVMEHLKKDDERIKNFVTLSPVPGFWDKYLKPILEGKDDRFSLKSDKIPEFFSKKERKIILNKAGMEENSDWKKFNKALLKILLDHNWIKDKDLTKALERPMIKIAAHYIMKEKTSSGRPLNPVANFHLRNGASVSEDNINFLANTSPKGLQESCSIMVNYIYSLALLASIERSLTWLGRIKVFT